MTDHRSTKSESLARYVDRLQEVAQYTFVRDEALKQTGLSPSAWKAALWRLQQKKRVVVVRNGFYVIVPSEHRTRGILPPDWFIHDLMKFLNQPYYVGLLSAAALHGAAHQRPQAYHVITSRATRMIEVAGVRIRFFKKENLQGVPVQKVRTFTGDILVSSPEATALDLVAYERGIGGLNRVLTVLQELGEKIEPDALRKAVEANAPLACVQRLGWLLDKAGHKAATPKLQAWLGRRKTKATRLDASKSGRGFPRNDKWNVIVNTKVEGDL